MKVLFVINGNTLIGKANQQAPHYPHIGIAYMTAILQKQGHEVNIVDMRLRYTMEELKGFIQGYRPDVIGISVWSLYYMYGYKTIDFLKENFPKLPVIMGGPHVSAFGKSVLKDSKADFALNGEGEFSFPRLLGALGEDRKELSDIDGLMWRQNGEIRENGIKNFIMNLDDISFPAYEKFEMERYMSVKERGLLPIITSRGCPFRCVFCGIKLSMGNTFRPRSAGNVVDELEHWYGKGFKIFDINDDTFTEDVVRAKRICDMIVERGLNIQYRFVNGIRADRLDNELAQKLKESGCIYVSFGVETGNKEIMKRIKKGVSFEKVREAVDLANRMGWVNQTNYIIGHPDETIEKAMDTLRFAESVKSTFVSFANAIPYPGTELYDWVSKSGKFFYTPEYYLNHIEYSDVKPIFETGEFSAAEREKVLRLGVELSRKRFAQFILGRFWAGLVFRFVKSDTMWAKLISVFQGNRLGFKFFRLFIRNKIKAKS